MTDPFNPNPTAPAKPLYSITKETPKPATAAVPQPSPAPKPATPTVQPAPPKPPATDLKRRWHRADGKD